MKIKDGFTTSISRAEGRRGKLAPLLKDSGFMLGWVQGKMVTQCIFKRA